MDSMFLFLTIHFLKNYKKNTIAIFFSFVLTFMLSTVLFVLVHTDHKIENLWYQTIMSPSDCNIKKLTKEQISILKTDSSIEKLSISQPRETYMKNGQLIGLSKGDDTEITMTAKLMEGRLPKAENEVAAEKWTLLNLGIEPVLNQEFTIGEEQSEPLKLTLVGILSDMPRNKKYGLLELYTILDKEESSFYTANIRFRNSVAYKKKLKELQEELGIRKKQIRYNPAREDMEELFLIDIQVMSIVLLVCMVVFYGIYRIGQITRRKQYGILRAIGMKQKQLRNMILLELYQIYCVSVPIGIVMGLLLSWLVVKCSGDQDTVIYLYNESVRFVPIIPVKQILLFTVIVAILIGILGYITGIKTGKKQVIELLSLETEQKKLCIFSIFKLKKKAGKWQTLCSLSGKYIIKDIRTSCFVILTICTGISLFIGLSYQAKILYTNRQDTKELYYLNGQYEMSVLSYDSPYQGVSRQDVKDIKELPNVLGIKTLAGLPIRVLDDGRKRDSYYKEQDEKLMEFYGYHVLAGNDGKDQIFKSNLFGYNTEALKELEKYIISGNFDGKSGLARDEIILAIPSLDDTKEQENKVAGWYKNGRMMMPYKAGDTIKIKYRADFKTQELEYEELRDYDKEYSYKEYKVVAVVSFDYIDSPDKRSVYPQLITSDQYIREIIPNGYYQNIYIDTDDNMTWQQQKELEQKLIQIGVKGNNSVVTRSLISEIRQNEMVYRKQLIYIFGIAMITFILVLINMVNNIIYHMQSRTREICMLRAIGMSIAMTKKVQIFENGILSCIAIILSYLISQPILRYLYNLSDMEVNGHSFSYDYKSFFMISIVMLLLCIGLSGRILKSWKTRQIMEGMGKIE